jgi:PAT family beta-lactamase induction signal transducer AmpG
VSVHEHDGPSPGGLTLPALSESRWLRFSTFTAFYFAQGVPIGLLTIALPAWMAEQGRDLAEIAGFSAVVGLPWAIKLIMGPLMDRFTFMPMGFRRPWALFAQFGLAMSFVAIALLGGLEGESLVLLTTLGFIANAFAASQDVAIDGMAIDVLPVEDRGRANAFMACGQRFGFAVFGAITGTLLVMFGLAVAAFTCAVAVGLVFLLGAIVIERPGERRMPWSPGAAAEVDRATEPGVGSYMRQLIVVLFMPMSILLIAVEFLNRVRDGFAVVVQPIFATIEFGASTEVYTQANGIIDLTAAVVGVCIGPLIDRAGAKRFLLGALVASAALHLLMAFSQSLWKDSTFILPMWAAISFAGQVIFIAIIAMFMNICTPSIAATQFAIYMSLANLSRTAGMGILAAVGGGLTTQDNFIVMGGLLIAAAAMLVFVREQKPVV